MADDVGERLARVEAAQETIKEVVEVRVRSYVVGYVDGQIQSVNGNVAASTAEIQGQVDRLKVVVHGRDGGNGMRATVWRLKWISALQWIAIVGLVAAETGVRIPWMIP